MKKSFFICLVLLTGAFAASIPMGARAQSAIQLADAGKHVGDSVTVSGKVFGARYLESGAKQPTLINLGGAYPHQLLTVVIFGPERKLFSFKPEEQFLNKNLTVSGKIELFKGKPQIVIHQAAQVRE
ncbi:MAG: hypothetical protein P4L51_17300 [Puia sp.]|nr:hypothetical protein [Puia sp.]